jgi:hypothetical protein
MNNEKEVHSNTLGKNKSLEKINKVSKYHRLKKELK